MTDKPRTDKKAEIDRRAFVAGALGAAAGIGALLADGAQAQPPAAVRPEVAGPPVRSARDAPPAALYKLEADVRDCQVDGKVPTDLNGAFYRVARSPVPAAPARHPVRRRRSRGHVPIKNGASTTRAGWCATSAGWPTTKPRELFPIYRNPSQDDPSVKG